MILLGAGNHLSKTVKISKKHRDIYKAKADIILETLSKLHYHAINVGEYDLGFGIEYLKSKQRKLKLPFISANLANETGTLFFPPSKLVSIDGIKVGIVGIIKHRIKKGKIPGGKSLTVFNPVKIVKVEAEKLKSRGASIIIVLTDMDDMKSRILTKRELPINVIISSCRRNRVSLPSIQNKKIILHLNRYGENVGCLKVIYFGKKAPKTHVVTGGATALIKGFLYKNSIIPLGHLINDDEGIAKLIDAFAKKYPYAR